MQTLYLATHFNPIYWNTAFLIVNSGSISIEDGDQSDYSKIAKAIGEIRNAGIKVSLVDINKSEFGFKPDADGNQILFGLKGLQNVGDDLIKLIIERRPYCSMLDFINKVGPNKQAMIALIKGGAFDQFKSRKRTMAEYLWLTCDKKKRLTLQNMPGLIKYNLLPEDEPHQIMARRVFEFNRYLKAQCKGPDQDSFFLDARAIDFISELNQEELIEGDNKVNKKTWDKKVYQPWMDVFRSWISENKDEILMNLNTLIFRDDWNKYAQGTISAWEMEALCFYYHDHELAALNKFKYGIVNFFDLSPEPIVEKTFRRGQADIPIYKIFRICGTCIAKNKTKSTVYLLTLDGVVPVKFRQEYFSLFDKQISERKEDRSKKILEKSWFNRGNMIMVQGIRREDNFIAKKYNSTPGHTIYHIDDIDEQGNITLRSDRKQSAEEEEE